MCYNEEPGKFLPAPKCTVPHVCVSQTVHASSGRSWVLPHIARYSAKFGGLGADSFLPWTPVPAVALSSWKRLCTSFSFSTSNTDSASPPLAHPSGCFSQSITCKPKHLGNSHIAYDMYASLAGKLGLQTYVKAEVTSRQHNQQTGQSCG